MPHERTRMTVHVFAQQCSYRAEQLFRGLDEPIWIPQRSLAALVQWLHATQSLVEIRVQLGTSHSKRIPVYVYGYKPYGLDYVTVTEKC